MAMESIYCCWIVISFCCVCDHADASDKLSRLIIYYDSVSHLLSISWLKIKQVDYLFGN